MDLGRSKRGEGGVALDGGAVTPHAPPTVTVSYAPTGSFQLQLQLQRFCNRRRLLPNCFPANWVYSIPSAMEE